MRNVINLSQGFKFYRNMDGNRKDPCKTKYRYCFARILRGYEFLVNSIFKLAYQGLQIRSHSCQFCGGTLCLAYSL